MNKSKEMLMLMDEVKAAEADARAIANKEGATWEEINAATNAVKAIKAKIEMQKAFDEGKEFDADGVEVPENQPARQNPKDQARPFKSLGEQLVAIAQSSRQGATIDNRLLEIQNASGANESIPSEGGFLVQQDFATELIQNIHETAVLASKCTRIPISANANSVKMLGVDETSRATGSRWGGVQGYWADEAATITASKPKWRKIELTLNKLMALYYATDELLADSQALEGILRQAFTEELAFLTDDAIYRGTGAGRPLGVLNAGCLVSVTAEAGQAADTVVYENIVKMWSRMPQRSRANAVWYINQELEPQLHQMYLAIGTAGVPVYLPANGVAGQPYGTLFGRPVIPIEHASAPGDVGDILLADMSQYLLADKGGVQTASSMHVKFEYDEMAFRVTYRVDGQPKLAKSITPYKGSNAMSPFVALAAR